MREVEIKCEVAEDFSLRAEDLVGEGGELSCAQIRRNSDVYFDTDDLRLARWGVTLRLRNGEDWTVKIPRPAARSSVLDRDEIRIDGDPSAIPAEAAALVAPFARHAALVEVATVETERTAQSCRRADGTPLGELVDDHVTGTTPRGTVRFREIELEFDAGEDPAATKALIEQLGPDGDRPAVPKLVRILGQPATEPPDVVCPELSKHPTSAEVIHAAIATSVQQLLSNAPAARLGLDPEGVHQARVATRRLRSDLRTFAPLLDKEWARQLRRELSWLAAELGSVRDADVLGAHIGAALDANPEIASDDGAQVLSCLTQQRLHDLDTLRTHLADSRSIELFDHLVEAAATPHLRDRAHRLTAATALPPLVRASWDALRSAVDDLGEEPADVELHEIRILAKRARYAAEAVMPAAGKNARRFAKAAASIQDSLGDLHDSVVAADWLEHAAISGLTPSAAFAAGRVAQQLRSEASPNRVAWQPSYDKMHRRSGWLDE